MIKAVRRPVVVQAVIQVGGVEDTIVVFVPDTVQGVVVKADHLASCVCLLKEISRPVVFVHPGSHVRVGVRKLPAAHVQDRGNDIPVLVGDPGSVPGRE